MTDEAAIARLETILNDVVLIGGQNEQTSMIPNLIVVDNAPTGLTDFITVADNKDGDTILAKSVPGVIYSINDLVNVLFVEGTEPIAFQQGSGSSSAGIWEIVPATSTDIFFDKGDVGIGKSVAPDASLEILDTSQAQLRLTHTEDAKFVDLTLDTNHDLTIKPSSNGQIILQPTTDSTDFFQVLDTDGGTPVLNVDTTNEFIGVGTASPEVELHLLNTGTEGTPATLGRTTMILQNSGAAGNFTAMAIIGGNTGASIIDFGDTDDIDVGSFQYFHSVNEIRILVNGGTEGIRIDSNGNVGIGGAAPLAQLHVDQASTTAAEPVLLLDQADVSEPFIKYVGTAAAATLTQSIVAEADVTTATRQGFVKIEIDDIGNQVADQDYFVAFYTLA